MKNRFNWLLALAVGVGLTACDTDELLNVDEPTFATPETLDSPAAVPTLFAGALGDFQVAYSGAGDDSFLAVSALFSDELRSSDTFTTRNATDTRNQFDTQQGNTSNAAYNRLQYARRSAGEVADAVARHINTQDVRYATLKSLEGFAIVALGEAFCGAVPLSTSVNAAPGAEGTPLSTSQLFQQAVARFDEALGGTPTSNLARVGKARALLNNGEFAAAAAAVTGVPTTFIHRIEHSANTGRQNNPIFVLQDNRRYTMSDNEGTNGLPFRSANDPRTPWRQHAQLGFDQATPLFIIGRHPERGSPVILADGIEARLIEAEAALQAGGAGWLGILNDLRANVGPLMTARYPGYTAFPQAANPLPPLTDPGTQAARVDLLFRERAFWLYATGHRMGDLRRLVRQYQRPQNTVFPTGAWHKGGTYGTDVNFPIPFNEGQNSLYEHEMCNTKQA
jgi:starch-binding outer membrane protein, SusD/RagB family